MARQDEKGGEWKAPALMFQGTGSDVGKSLLVAGLCRVFLRRGLRVLPFKPQNMSNNAAITSDGGEIGRAQALQAAACRVEPTSDMNPVLLKPESENGSLVVVQGRAAKTVRANEYLEYRKTLRCRVMESFDRLRRSADIVLVEGAGSMSEVNLRDGDIANMGFALDANIDVILVTDIDRGGSIASVVGSYDLLEEDEKALVRGYVINKFRGDYSIFKPAERIIEERTGLRCFGFVRWLSDMSRLPAEDSLALEKNGDAVKCPRGSRRNIKIYVLGLSRIANFDDFDPLAAEDDVDLEFVKPGSAVPGDGDLIIIPGTKSTIADLEFIRQQGWDIDIAAHIRRGGRVLGICGGYQILGRKISDPHAIENPSPATVDGLGLLDVSTVMYPEKTLRRFSSVTPEGSNVAGYEIHIGKTSGPETQRPMIFLDGVPEGALRSDDLVAGCYIHGLFTSDSYRSEFLSAFRGKDGLSAAGFEYEKLMDDTIDELADEMERSVDVYAIASIAGLTI
jgi:adenosylcobyric acid synthase